MLASVVVFRPAARYSPVELLTQGQLIRGRSRERSTARPDRPVVEQYSTLRCTHPGETLAFIHQSGIRICRILESATRQRLSWRWRGCCSGTLLGISLESCPRSNTTHRPGYRRPGRLPYWYLHACTDRSDDQRVCGCSLNWLPVGGGLTRGIRIDTPKYAPLHPGLLC